MNRDPINQKSYKFSDKHFDIKKQKRKDLILNIVLTIVCFIVFVVYLRATS